MGKNYLSSKPAGERNKNDLYHTPFSLTWALLEKEFFTNWYEPCCGSGAIVTASSRAGYEICSKTGDISTGQDFLTEKKWEGDILTNFPFNRWDKFVEHAKKIASGRICTIGRLNYLGTVSRYKSKIWEGLRVIYTFNRYPDYRTPYREDGHFHVGGLCSGWFLWEPGYKGPHELRFLDVQNTQFWGNIWEVNKMVKIECCYCHECEEVQYLSDCQIF